MLVLSRKTGQRVLIGDNISVTVVRIAPGVVRLGIEAPGDLTIIREELKEQAVQSNAADWIDKD
jgi:carbon storage regulator